MATNSKPETDVPADEENDAAAKPPIVADPPKPDPEAAKSSGEKYIRCRHGDRFQISEKLEVDGEWRKYPATQAKEIIEAAARNGVRLAIADVEKKG